MQRPTVCPTTKAATQLLASWQVDTQHLCLSAPSLGARAPFVRSERQRAHAWITGSLHTGCTRECTSQPHKTRETLRPWILSPCLCGGAAAAEEVRARCPRWELARWFTKTITGVGSSNDPRVRQRPRDGAQQEQQRQGMHRSPKNSSSAYKCENTRLA